jgi:FkbM family methyltransferase
MENSRMLGVIALARRVLAIPFVNRLRIWVRRKQARYETVFGFNPSPDWIDYLLRNSMPEKVAALRRGLDASSLALVNLVFQRLSLLPVANGYLGYTQMDARYLESLSTDDEKALRRAWNHYMRHQHREFVLDEKTRKADTFVCHSGLWNKSDRLKRYIEGKDFIDGGAYIGDTALVYLRHYGPRKVWSFEISARAGQRFAANLKRNGVSDERVSLIPMGLSDEVGEMSFSDTGSPGTTLFSGGGHICRLTDLDSFAEEHRLLVGFIKADVEGAGVAALKGMEQTIRRDRPVLSLAMYHSPVEFFEMKPLLDRIVDGLGYRVTIEKHWPFAGEMLEIALFAYPQELD